MWNHALAKALVSAVKIVVVTNVKSIITTPSIKFYRSFSILQEYYTKKESRFARCFYEKKHCLNFVKRNGKSVVDFFWLYRQGFPTVKQFVNPLEKIIKVWYYTYNP